MAELVVCTVGCCPGCQFCYGMAIGCHRDKCRCGRPGQCPECNLTQPEDGHRDMCPIGDAEEAAAESLRAVVRRDLAAHPKPAGFES